MYFFFYNVHDHVLLVGESVVQLARYNTDNKPMRKCTLA